MHKMKVISYLNSMKKMERIIKESSEGQFSYLQYLDFYKNVDKEMIKFLAYPLKTPDKMFDSSFKTYTKLKNCKKMKLVITGRTKLPESKHF